MSHKILVVEDSRAFRNYLFNQLSQLGYEVICAESLAETQAILSQDHRFFCTVLDYCLPDAQDGEVIDLVLSTKQKVVVLTATFNEKVRERCIAKGVLDYILKDSMSSVSYLIPMMKRLLNNQNHHALVVDDSQTVRRYVSQLLEHQYIRTTTAVDGLDALKKLQQHKDISIIITDHDMPHQDGIEMIREIRQSISKNELAILGVSSSDDKTMTARFLKAGANDFLNKPFNQEEFYCRVHQLLDIKEANTELFRLANQDALTGLWNRRYFFNQRQEHQADNCHVAMMDIDHFKKVNDTWGHDGGDKVLTSIAHILNLYFSDSIVARFGGEEFCIQFCGEFAQFIQRLENLRQRIEKTSISFLDSSIRVTISIGVAQSDTGDINQLLTLADSRLYLAKNRGRNQLISD
ncbi:GGDEF domain-containing response regulator [Vibrio porteresiae]|uniref:diguanylate cyclase n=1 Tax=Vibrio porteresiae DSM 19223 TaxID=1123496 RepID=A0ABZ0QE29_9VIBR|nr:response regulator [Vibrio porteresiae]WPC74724.1 diguanylate cyclase [Vibrio porteresiae DSM 19223]